MKRLAIAIFVLSLIDSPGHGQQPAASGVAVDSVYSEADVQEKPERLSGPAPVYPQLLREAQIEGTVVVEAIIDTLGHVEPNSLRVVQTVNPGFNESAKRYVLRSAFRPGRVHGQPVRVLVKLPIDYELKGH